MDSKQEDSLTQRVRQARGKFFAMAAAFSLTAFNDNFYRTAAIAMAKAAGLQWFQSRAMFLFALPYLVFAAPVGWLADRFPKRWIVIGAKVLEVVAVALGAVGICTSNWTLMAAMVFLMGLQSAIFSPALCGAIPELYPAVYVTAANAKLRAATTTAILFGTALAPEVLDDGGAVFWHIARGQAVVAGVVLVVTLIGLAASFGVPYRPAAAPKAKFPWTGPIDTMVELWRICKDHVLALTIASVAFVYFIGGVQIMLILDLQKYQYHLSGKMVSLLLLCEGVGIAAGGVLSTLFARGERWHRVLVVAVWGLAAALGLIALVPYAPVSQGWQVGLLLALVWFAGVLGGLMLIPAESFTQVRPAAGRKGAVLAAANFATFAGIMITGSVAGRLMELLKQPTACFGALGAMAALMGMALYFGLPRSGVRKSNAFLIWLTNRLLRLRYRIEIKGLDAVAERGTDGILFLPNHPALIDPVMMVATLHGGFRPVVWADQDQIDRPVIRTLAPRFGVWPVPAVSRYGAQSGQEVARAIETSVETLRGGRSLMLYPSGHVYRAWLEDLRGNTAVHSILEQLPQARVVLVRTRGLWGSSFSWAGGEPPSVGRALRQGLGALLLSGVFFAPRRRVTIEFVEPPDLPRGADRETLNRYLEAFYNEGAEHNTYVPYSIWEKGGVRQLPEPVLRVRAGETDAVPEATRRIVLDHLREVAGRPDVGPGDHLARDLGLDSLARTELIAWLEQEFGFPQGNAESLETVADVMLAACGEAVAGGRRSWRPCRRCGWRRAQRASASSCRRGAPSRRFPDGGPPGARQRRRGGPAERRADLPRPGHRHLCAPREIGRLPGERMGIMLPASVAAAVALPGHALRGQDARHGQLDGRPAQHAARAGPGAGAGTC